MALTNDGTRVSVASVPDGYTRPSVTGFTDFKYIYPATISVDKASVDESTATATYGALVSSVNTQAQALVNTDFDTTNTVQMYVDLIDVNSNQTAADALFTNEAEAYDCKVNIYVKTS